MCCALVERAVYVYSRRVLPVPTLVAQAGSHLVETEKRISEGIVRMDNRSGLKLSALEVQTILSVARSAHIEVLSSRTLTPMHFVFWSL